MWIWNCQAFKNEEGCLRGREAVRGRQRVFLFVASRPQMPTGVPKPAGINSIHLCHVGERNQSHDITAAAQRLHKHQVFRTWFQTLVFWSGIGASLGSLPSSFWFPRITTNLPSIKIQIYVYISWAWELWYSEIQKMLKMLTCKWPVNSGEEKDGLGLIFNFLIMTAEVLIRLL